MYQDKSGAPGNERVKLVVQTPEGELYRLRSVNGRPITPEQDKQEVQRIERLLSRPNEQRKRHAAEEKDDRQTQNLFRMIPNAVISSYGEHRGDLVEILFKPNPNFNPPTHEAAVFREMAGRIWINQKQGRLVEIEGHLIENVKFADGLLGHLDKGGEFHVKQSEIAPGNWEITLLHVNMHGRVLFLKTISVHEDKVRTDFQRVPDNLTLAQAAEQLQKQSTATSAAFLKHSTVK